MALYDLCFTFSISTTGGDMSSDALTLVWGSPGAEKYLSLSDLCALSSTRKDWQTSIAAVYSSQYGQKLQQTLAAGLPELTANEFTNKQLLHQLWALVSLLKQAQPWGPAVAATPGLLADYSQLITVPYLPQQIVKSSVQQLGVHISYQQLLTAAHNRVGGVETWVQVQHELDIQTDIPDIVSAVCVRVIGTQEVVSTTPISKLAHLTGVLSTP